jgi:hypothetical protein
MKTNFKILVLAALSVSVLSCNNNKDSQIIANPITCDFASIESSPPSPPQECNFMAPVTQNNILSNSSSVNKKKIIKDGSIKIEADNIKESKKKLDILVKNFNGYIADESYNDENGTSEYIIKIRVPFENFEQIVSSIESGNRNIVSKNISARDVTEEFIDLETRLKNKKNYLIKYNELLKQAESVEDILKIEENTRTIEEEIESTEGRLKYLNDQVSYSTLDITLFLKKEYIEKSAFKGNFFDRLGQAIVSGVSGIIEFIIYIFRIWPIWVITIITIILIKRNIKRIRNRKSKVSQNNN